MDSWPTQSNSLTHDSSVLESRSGVLLVVAAPTIDYHWDLIHHYSSLTKLFRVTALCFRYLSRLRKLPNTSSAAIIPSADMEWAKLFWVKVTQAVYLAPELKALKKHSPLPKTHAFNRLTAFIECQGVIRVGGRLTQSALTHEGKHPAILPRRSKLSTLIIDMAHKRTLHGGIQLTLAHTTHSYWILGGRAPVKNHVLRCVVCARQMEVRAHQLTGQLPLFRVTPSHDGVDYAGPLTLKAWKGRGAKTYKGWICVFVCFDTSAVHLEPVSDYSTEGFIAAYRRFTLRRVIAHTLYLDGGTNFIAADPTLRKLYH